MKHMPSKIMPYGALHLGFIGALERFSFYSFMMVFGFLFSYLLPVDFSFNASLVTLGFITPLIGGWMADYLWGNQKTMKLGLVLMLLGFLGVLLTFQIANVFLFYTSISAFMLGSGMVRCNVLVLFGKLYNGHEMARDTGFTALYVMMAVGTAMAALFYHFGSFTDIAILVALAGALGLLYHGRKSFGYAGVSPSVQISVKGSLKQVQWFFYGSLVVVVPLIAYLLTFGILADAALPLLTALSFGALLYIGLSHGRSTSIFAILITLVATVLFLSFFEQSHVFLQLFQSQAIDASLDPVMGNSMAETLFENLNGARDAASALLGTFFLVLVGLVLMVVFKVLSRRGLSVTGPVKLSIGFAFTALGFISLANSYVPCVDTTTCNPNASMWMFVLYGSFGLAELLIIPTCYGTITRLAPGKFPSIFMGVCLLAFSLAQLLDDVLIGRFDMTFGFLEEIGLASYASGFSLMAWGALAVGLVLLALSPALRSVFAPKDK